MTQIDDVEAAKKLRKAAERLARLQKDPAFLMLVAEIEKKRERMRETATGRMMSGEDLATLQRQVDYDRGFVDGALYGKQVVDAAAAKLREYDEERETLIVEAEEEDGWARYEGEGRSA